MPTQEFPITERERIVVKADHYRKRQCVDVRVWFVPLSIPANEIAPEDWEASKKGVKISLKQAQPIAQAIVDTADDMAREIEENAEEEAEE